MNLITKMPEISLKSTPGSALDQQLSDLVSLKVRVDDGQRIAAQLRAERQEVATQLHSRTATFAKQYEEWRGLAEAAARFAKLGG